MPPITPTPYHVSSFDWDFFFLRFLAIIPVYQKGLIKVHFCNMPLEENKRAQEVIQLKKKKKKEAKKFSQGQNVIFEITKIINIFLPRQQIIFNFLIPFTDYCSNP